MEDTFKYSKERKIKVAEILRKAILVGDCLISHLAPNAKGYVPLSFGGRKGIKYRANRAVLEEKLGRTLLPEEKALHTCDVRNCINPGHLFVGTDKDNTQDMLAKGRHKYEVHEKITHYTQIMRMDTLRLDGHSNVQIGKFLGISHETVREYLKEDSPRRVELIMRGN